MKTKKNSFKGKSLYRPTGKAGEYSAWACNFYTGCSNNCSYCYCKRGVMSHVWSDEPMLKKCFKDKDHAVAVFEKEMLANIDELRKTGIFFSFTTDPMIPGKTLELTMEAVGLALRNDVPVQILAKRADWLDAEAHGTHSRHEAMSRTGLSHIRKRRADCRYSQFGMGDE